MKPLSLMGMLVLCCSLHAFAASGVVTIESPATNSIVNSPVLVHATYNGTASYMKLWIDHVAVISQHNGSVFDYSATLANGPHLLEVQARDAASNITYTTPVNITATGQSGSLLRNNTSAMRGVPQSNDAVPASVSKMDVHALLHDGLQTRVLVRYMPWWGDPKHIDVGYREDDPGQVSRQVEDMASRGIDGAIVAWYGPKDRFKDGVTHQLLRDAEQQGRFEVGVSIDIGAMEECVKSACDVTAEFSSLIEYVAREFWSSPAYLKYKGRPVLTSFGLEKLAIDWNRVKQNAPGNPILLFRNSGGFDKPASDGAFAWIAPETATALNPMGTEYLRQFYKTALAHKGAVVMGSAYSGFNDAAASWGKGRKIDQGCGQTWLETFALANEYVDRGGTLPFLIVPTWNDYEEGTEIESGIDNCVTMEAQKVDGVLQWTVHGDERTIAQYVVYSGGAEVARLPRGTHSWTMIGEGQFTVVAAGVSSVRNQMVETIP